MPLSAARIDSRENGFAPTQFTHRSDRLAFSNGIIVLTSAMALTCLAAACSADPARAVGIFIVHASGGMVRHCSRRSAGICARVVERRGRR